MLRPEPPGLPTRRHRSLRQPEHTVLQQLRSRGDDVFVVTEVLQTQKEVEVNRAHKQEGSGRFVLSGAVSLQVCSLACAQGRGGGQEGGVPRQTPGPTAQIPEPSPEPRSTPQGQGQGHRSQKKTVTIPSGSILAFRVVQLQITDSKWGEPGRGTSGAPRPRLHGKGTGRPGKTPGLLGGAGGTGCTASCVRWLRVLCCGVWVVGAHSRH